MPTTFEEACQAQEFILKMPEFQYPAVNGVGITKKDGQFAVSVNFVGDRPDGELPEQVLGVGIVYRFGLGEVVMLKS